MPRKNPEDAIKHRAKFNATPSGEDELRGSLRRAEQERAKRIKPGPAAADEMWLLGGPESTAQGGFALASAKTGAKKRKKKFNARTV